MIEMAQAQNLLVIVMMVKIITPISLTLIFNLKFLNQISQPKQESRRGRVIVYFTYTFSNNFVYYFNMNNLINYIKSIDFNSLLDRANLIIFSIVVLSVGFLGWIPLMLVLQYFSTAYLLYTFVFKVLTKIPGFSYVQLLYLEVITIFPIIDVALKTVNPFYN